MTKITWQIVFIIILLAFCSHTWSAAEESHQNKDSLSDENTTKIITIQVISLKNEAKAVQELNRLKSHDLEVVMRHEAVGDKGMWYRIYVGQFTSRKLATQFAQKIRDQGIIPDFWVKTIKIAREPDSTPMMAGKPTEKPDLPVDGGGVKPEVEIAPIEILDPTPPPEKIPLLAQIPTESGKTATPMQGPESPPKKPEDRFQEPALIPGTTEKETIKAADRQEVVSEEKEAPKFQSIAVQGPENQLDDGRFSLGIRSSYFFASKAEDFIIERTSTNDTDAWSFQNDKLYAALVSSYRLTPSFSLEIAFERTVFTKLDNWHIGVGPKIELKKIKILRPYVRGALVIGRLEWDDAPGDFEPGMGFEGGLGVSVTKSNVQFGVEGAYRVIEYDYNTPSGTEVTATDDTLDLSGYALSVTIGYQF